MSGQLKEVRDRIKSVKNTQQITKAMKMVSAAKLRRAQQAIVQMRPYSDRLDRMLKNILANIEGDAVTSFGVERTVEKVLLVVNTSNRGLCGAFNSNIIKTAVKKLEEEYKELVEKRQVTMLCIGKRANDYFRKRYDLEYITDYVEVFNDLTYDTIAEISQMLMDEFTAGTYDRVDVVYGRFKNAATQFPTSVQFLPVPKPEMDQEEEKSTDYNADYIFEPSKHELLEHLVPSILQTSFYKYLLDTHASEHGARMTAMDKATENAQEMLSDLKIHYNKARQEAITKELSEIVGGAAALGG